MRMPSPFVDEGIIDIDGPGFLGDFQDEEGDFAPPTLAERTQCPPHPGAILRDFYLPPTGVTVTALAERLNVSRQSVSQIVNESKPVTVDMANRLARALGTSPQLWLNLQRNMDVWQSLHEKREEYEKIVALPRKIAA